MFIYILHLQTPSDVRRNRHIFYLYTTLPRRPIKIFLFRLMTDILIYDYITPLMLRHLTKDNKTYMLWASGSQPFSYDDTLIFRSIKMVTR